MQGGRAGRILGPMTSERGYGQYCPIAVAAEILAERWTPLVLRALLCGATRYSEIRESVPRMSTALLSRRLRTLEDAGILSRTPDTSAPGHDYRLTGAGRALLPVLEAMGYWSQHWLRREITRDANLDPDILMWELRRAARAGAVATGPRRVVQFGLDGVDPARRRYWLVFEPGDIDICARDPGFAIDLWVTAHMRSLVEVWLGHRGLDAAVEEGAIRLDGNAAERAAFRDWFVLSRFAGTRD